MGLLPEFDFIGRDPSSSGIGVSKATENTFVSPSLDQSWIPALSTRRLRKLHPANVAVQNKVSELSNELPSAAKQESTPNRIMIAAAVARIGLVVLLVFAVQMFDVRVSLQLAC
jgi:hypothetical protein